MNKRLFCFIMCSNNKQYEMECIRYIEALEVPAGYSVEYRIIHDASSMASGYNKAMYSSGAKYKIYLHQDVFILNRRFLYELLRGFSDESVGMIGMVGCLKLPESCVMWYGDRVGIYYSNSIYSSVCNELKKISAPVRVEAVDGFLMATQYDIPWREDVFKGWDFYDVSQCFEFRKAGYDVIVPPSDKPWCFHDDGMLNLLHYNENRKLFKNTYIDMLN